MEDSPITSPQIQRAIEEQRKCAEFLRKEPNNRGAKLGLADWMAEEVFLRLEEKNGSKEGN